MFVEIHVCTKGYLVTGTSINNKWNIKQTWWNKSSNSNGLWMVGKYMYVLWWYMCIKCTHFFPEVCQWAPIKPRPYTNTVLTIPFRSSPAIDCCGSTTCCAKTRCDVLCCCAVPAIIFQHYFYQQPATATSTTHPHHTCTRTHTHISS